MKYKFVDRCRSNCNTQLPSSSRSEFRDEPGHAIGDVAGTLRIAIATAALLVLAGTASAGETPEAAKSAASEAPRSAVTTAVAGIVSYTRWPADASSIRLCTLGYGPGVDELLGAASLGSARLAVTTRAAPSAADAPKDCDVIYVGTVASSVERDLLQRTAGHPVLMIGEGHDFCSDGGMFCLLPGVGTVAFTVNLDAVARSGLRVNPWVLRIARNSPASGR